jgi:excisionase family DNA binding protein
LKLVDAIRKATSDGPHIVPQDTAEHASAPTGTASTFVENSESYAFSPQPGTNLVRLELFLSEEQIQMLLRGALSTHRSVMTVKEVANYLRLTVKAVEEMAVDGRLPAFRVSNSWRFLKAAVDDWMATMNTDTHGGTHHAA